ncbi:MAG: hypothetical protein K2G90_00735 [Muribaculaceae bacterium]|nr:hypothetical protein [Muribaculaceae bacterium]
MRTKKTAKAPANNYISMELTMVISTDWMDDAFKALDEEGLAPEFVCNTRDEATYVYHDVDGKENCDDLRKTVVAILVKAGIPHREYTFEAQPA